MYTHAVVRGDGRVLSLGVGASGLWVPEGGSVVALAAPVQAWPAVPDGWSAVVSGGAVVAQDLRTTEQQAVAVRAERNRRLKDSDWAQLADIPPQTRAKWAPYRQALRDISDQPGFPQAIEWPQAPG